MCAANSWKNVGSYPLDATGKVLDEAADTIQRRGWCQHRLYDEQSRVCMLAAVHEGHTLGQIVPAFLRLRSYLGSERVSYWNDYRCHSQDQAVQALRAI
jgi:hypothetical protein